MTGSQLVGLTFLLAGLAALAARREDLMPVQVASDAVLLLAGISSMLVGAVLLLLTYLKQSVEY